MFHVEQRVFPLRERKRKKGEHVTKVRWVPSSTCLGVGMSKTITFTELSAPNSACVGLPDRLSLESVEVMRDRLSFRFKNKIFFYKDLRNNGYRVCFSKVCRRIVRVSQSHRHATMNRWLCDDCFAKQDGVVERIFDGPMPL